jgi:hypothetical protein
VLVARENTSTSEKHGCLLKFEKSIMLVKIGHFQGIQTLAEVLFEN